MKDNLNNIGDLFRDTLKDYHMDSDTSLWNRLDSQLSAQPTVPAPKPASVLHHFTWLKVAAAASVLVGAALAYNFIYLPLQQNETTPQTNTIIEENKNPIAVDSAKTQTEQENPVDSHAEPLYSNSLAKNATEKNDYSTSAEKTTPATNNPTVVTNATANNNYQSQPQQAATSNSQNSTNNQNKVAPKKDSVIQALPKVTDKPVTDAHQNTVLVQDITQKDEVVLNTDIPNLFTPNSDGFNDYFVIRNIEKCSSNQLVIKDRSGRIIFEKINYQNDWNASNVPDGVYFYFFKYNVSGNNFGKMGSITIKR